MGEPKRRLCGVLTCKAGKRANDRHQTRVHKAQAVPHDEHVGIVSHVAGGGPKVDDGHRRRAALAKGMHVSHHIVPQLFFVLRRAVKVNVVQMGAHFIELHFGNGQPQLPLALREPEPQPAPGGELMLRRKKKLHLVACIARGQRRLIAVVFSHRYTLRCTYNVVLYHKSGGARKQKRPAATAAGRFVCLLTVPQFCPGRHTDGRRQSGAARSRAAAEFPFYSARCTARSACGTHTHSVD